MRAHQHGTHHAAGCPLRQPRAKRLRLQPLCSTAAVESPAAKPSASTKTQRVVVLGGTGRVGGSTAEALLDRRACGTSQGAPRSTVHCSAAHQARLCHRLPGEQLEVTVASRQEKSYSEAAKKRPSLQGARFKACDIDSRASLEVPPAPWHPSHQLSWRTLHSGRLGTPAGATRSGWLGSGRRVLPGADRSLLRSAWQAALEGADLVLHAAGPFQRKGSRLVLETAIAMGVPYVDVCDDAEYAQSCKELHQQAVQAGVPAITTAGIYPGARAGLATCDAVQAWCPQPCLAWSLVRQ